MLDCHRPPAKSRIELKRPSKLFCKGVGALSVLLSLISTMQESGEATAIQTATKGNLHFFFNSLYPITPLP